MSDHNAILDSEGVEAPQPAGEPVSLIYTNWRGETRARTIRPLRIFWGSNEWHKEPQWLIEAVDVEKGETRTFALAGIGTGDIAPEPAAETEALRVRVRELEDVIHKGCIHYESHYSRRSEVIVEFYDDDEVPAAQQASALVSILSRAMGSAALNRVAQPEEQPPSKRQVAGSSPAGVADGWRPIETAPRDGSQILWRCMEGEYYNYAVIQWPEYELCFENGEWMYIPGGSPPSPPPAADAEGERT